MKAIVYVKQVTKKVHNVDIFNMMFGTECAAHNQLNGMMKFMHETNLHNKGAIPTHQVQHLNLPVLNLYIYICVCVSCHDKAMCLLDSKASYKHL